MIRVHVICEGQTEEMFVNKVLLEAFLSQGILLVPSLVGKPGHKGGNFKFERLLNDVKIRLLGDTTSYCTTFYDFYGLPENFPGKNEANDLPFFNEKAEHMNATLIDRLEGLLGNEAMRRFIPYIQMYEFEALLFSSPETLAVSIGCKQSKERFQSIRDDFDSPEEINNSPQTAPSKRIEKLCIGYDKVTAGSIAAMDMGLDDIRRECALFDAWLKKIEDLSNASA